MDILHKNHAQLVQQDHQALLEIGRKDLALAGCQYLEQGSQEGLVAEQLVARVADEQFVQLQLLQPHSVGIPSRGAGPLVQLVQQILAEQEFQAGRRRRTTSLGRRQRDFVAVMQLHEQQGDHVVQVRDHAQHVVVRGRCTVLDDLEGLLPVLTEAVVASARIAVCGSVDGSLSQWAAVSDGGNASTAALAQPHRCRCGVCAIRWLLVALVR